MTWAQNLKGKITGTVISGNGEKLGYATATIKGSRIGTTTNDEGQFVLEVAPGSYTLAVSFTGYHPVEKQVSVQSGENTNVGTITLNESSEMIGEITVDGMITKFSKKESEVVARMPLKNLDNPQVYTVVPKELFTEQIDVNFRSALMSSPGVANVTLGLGSGGTGLAMHLRGFTGANGAGAIRNGLATNWVSLSDPANLESLEIIKGPSATLFGSTLTSYGGLVNRVTKQAHEGTGGEIGFSTGSIGLGRLSVDYNTPLNDEGTLLFRVNAAIHREKSFQDYGVNKTTMFAPTITYIASDRLTFNFDVEYFESQRNTTYLRLSGTPVTNLDDLNWDFRKSYTSNELLSSAKVLNTMAKATYKLSDTWESQTALSYSNTDNNANYLFLLLNNTSTITRRVMNIPSLFNTIQLQQNFVGKFKIGGMDNKLLFGLDFTQLKTTDTRRYVNFDQVEINGDDTWLDAAAVKQTLDATDPYVRNKRSRKTYSAYASDVLNMTNRLIAMASLRVDNYHDIAEDYTQTALSPKLGLIYQVIDDKISLFGNYMNGFSNVAPGYTEESPDNPVKFEPEHANQVEGGLKFELIGNKLNGTLSYYDIRVENKVRSVTGEDNNTYSVQDGTQKSSGFEMDLIANPVKGMHIVLGYGYNDSEYTNVSEALDGNRPYSTPEHVANFWVSHRVTKGQLDGFGIGFGGNYSSDYYLNDANTITVPGFFKFDGTVFYDRPTFRIGLKINNLTDKEYWMSDYDAEPQSPRTFIANFTMRF
jgi:iron complex outermembrane receptor protein